MQMVGLKNNFKQIEEIKSLPHSILLLGAEGSGKRTFANLITNQFLNVPLVEITEALSPELLDTIYLTVDIQAYLIDLRKLGLSNQSKILKFVEEPKDNIYIFVVANSLSEVLPTLETRLVPMTLDDYSVDELKEVAELNKVSIDEKYLGTLVKTPGDVIKVKTENINVETIDKLVNKVFSNLQKVNLSNALTIADKLNYKDEYDKINVDFFLNLLYNRSIEKYVDEKYNKYYIESNIINGYIQKIRKNSYLNKRNLIFNLVIDLWNVENGVE